VNDKKPDRFAVSTVATSAAAYRELSAAEAKRNGLPPQLADSVMAVESGYNPGAIGGAGEIGLMQILPSTTRMMGFTGSISDPAVPETNTHYGVAYLAQAWGVAGAFAQDGNVARLPPVNVAPAEQPPAQVLPPSSGEGSAASNSSAPATLCKAGGSAADKGFGCLNQKLKNQVDQASSNAGIPTAPLDAKSTDLKVGIVNVPASSSNMWADPPLFR
jgi:hypothetical protein